MYGERYASCCYQATAQRIADARTYKAGNSKLKLAALHSNNNTIRNGKIYEMIQVTWLYLMDLYITDIEMDVIKAALQLIPNSRYFFTESFLFSLSSYIVLTGHFMRPNRYSYSWEKKNEEVRASKFLLPLYRLPVNWNFDQYSARLSRAQIASCYLQAGMYIYIYI